MSEPASSVPNLAGSLVSEVQLPQAPGYPARRQRVLILVGLVGSGKTTFSQALASGSSQWVRASQDDAPSRRRQECEELARRALRDGKDVIVDRVDFDPSQRVHFVRIAKEFANVDCDCLILDVPRKILEERLVARTNHPTITGPDHALEVLGRMLSSYKPPTPDIPEGFRRVYSLSIENQPADGQWTEETLQKTLNQLDTAPEGWTDVGKEIVWNKNLPPSHMGGSGWRGRGGGTGFRPTYNQGRPQWDRPGPGSQGFQPGPNGYQARPYQPYPGSQGPYAGPQGYNGFNTGHTNHQHGNPAQTDTWWEPRPETRL